MSITVAAYAWFDRKHRVIVPGYVGHDYEDCVIDVVQLYRDHTPDGESVFVDNHRNVWHRNKEDQSFIAPARHGNVVVPDYRRRIPFDVARNSVFSGYLPIETLIEDAAFMEEKYKMQLRRHQDIQGKIKRDDLRVWMGNEEITNAYMTPLSQVQGLIRNFGILKCKLLATQDGAFVDYHINVGFDPNFTTVQLGAYAVYNYNYPVDYKTSPCVDGSIDNASLQRVLQVTDFVVHTVFKPETIYTSALQLLKDSNVITTKDGLANAANPELHIRADVVSTIVRDYVALNVTGGELVKPVRIVIAQLPQHERS